MSQVHVHLISNSIYMMGSPTIRGLSTAFQVTQKFLFTINTLALKKAILFFTRIIAEHKCYKCGLVLKNGGMSMRSVGKAMHLVLVSFLILLEDLAVVISGLQFPYEDCNASHGLAIIGSRAKCRPHPKIEVMMDHITLNGNKLSVIKRLSPSHVTISQCAGERPK